ncbi:hypothetical protein O3M35_011656 [Rhynocoris fuscipes]|uniref:Uncharacterized protein n=1 Tax=Rhynocoris fuscipes TaxID=488301 RepID=A0AAW1D373_9HEMI
MMASYQDYWNQWQRQQQQYMMAPYYYYNKEYYQNYIQPQSSMYVSPSGSKSQMNPTNGMNPMVAMYPMNFTGGTVCPTGSMNPMGVMQPVVTGYPTGTVNPISSVVSPTGSYSTMTPTNSMYQQYYGMYPSQFYNNFQKYENYTVYHNDNKTENNYVVKEIKDDTKGNAKEIAMNRGKSNNDKKTVKHTWWKVDVNKNEKDFEKSPISTASSSIIQNTNESFTITTTNRQLTVNRIKQNQTSFTNMPNKSMKKQPTNQLNNTDIMKPKNSLIILKKEESISSETQDSQEIFHLINGTRPLIDSNEPSGIKQNYGYFDNTDMQSRFSTTKLGQQQIANLISNNNKLIKEENEKKSLANLMYHCQEILSKFTISETNNNFINNQSTQNLNTDQYTDLGKNINETMQFIMNEMNSLNTTNYLSMKLTPRQKQSIALLIIDEVNAINLPQKYWAHVCRLVIQTLNENFKSYFKKIKKPKKPRSKKVKNENNSKLWLVDLVNNIQTT